METIAEKYLEAVNLRNQLGAMNNKLSIEFVALEFRLEDITTPPEEREAIKIRLQDINKNLSDVVAMEDKLDFEIIPQLQNSLPISKRLN